jgi:hypothetical protein
MTAQMLVELLEEMVDLKVRQYMEKGLGLPPELKHLMRDQREADKRRLDQVRAQLVQFLEGESP